MVLGRDIRLSSEELADAVAAGVREAGAEVLDIGLGGTEMVYFCNVSPEGRWRHHGHGQP